MWPCGHYVVFSRDILGIGGTVGEIDFPDLIARSEEVEENVLIDAMLGKIEVKPMYRRFRAVLPRNVTPGTTGGQDMQDAVEHRTMVGSGSPDMRFLEGRCGSIIAQSSSSISRNAIHPGFYSRPHIIVG